METQIIIDRPKTLKAVVARIQSGMAYQSVIKEWKDGVLSSDIGDRSRFWVEEPPLTGDKVIDTYLAGMAEHLSVQSDQLPPEWVNHPPRFLSRPIFFGGENSREWLAAETPSAFRRRLLFCGRTRDE